MHTTLSRITELREALDDLAAALAEAREDGLVKVEARLAAIVPALPGAPPDTEDDRATAHAEALRARQALTACRRLGASLQDFVRWSIEWSAAPRYDSRGHAAGERGTSELSVRG